MFTNHKNFGGDFGKQILNDIKTYNTLEIASGYFGVSLIDDFTNDLISISKRGHCRILIGMIYHEGVSKNQKKTLLELNEKLNKSNSKSGIFISLRQFHGKLYKFTKNNSDEKIYIGSSNFSDSGFYENIECNALINEELDKKNISLFLSHLFYGNEFTAPLNEVELFVKSKKSKKIKDKLKNYEINENNFPSKTPVSQLDIKLRVDEQPRSSLNLYFEKGRKNLQGKYSPRPWYEVEITSKAQERTKDYPIGEFTAYAKDKDKFYKFKMLTASDNHKAITTKDNREILGEFLKGKLEREGYLEKYEKITLDTLRSYGRDYISLKKINDKEYYLDF